MEYNPTKTVQDAVRTVLNKPLETAPKPTGDKPIKPARELQAEWAAAEDARRIAWEKSPEGRQARAQRYNRSMF